MILFFLIFSCEKVVKNSDSQNTSTDSLSTYIAFAKNNDFNLHKRLKFNKKAFVILTESKNDSITRNQLYNVAFSFQFLGDDKTFRKSVELTIENSEQEKDTLIIAKSYNLLGNYHNSFSQNDSAYYFLLKSEKLFFKLKDSLGLAQNYMDKAFVQLYESDYAGCEQSAIKGLEYYKNGEDGFRFYDAYNLIGICSNELKNYDNALTYHAKALKTTKDNNFPIKMHLGANSLNNIGVVYQYQNKYKEAITQFRLALQEKDLLKDNPALYSMIVDNLAYSKFKLKDYKGLPELFNHALKIREDNNLISGIITNKIHLSEYYAERKDTINSQKFAKDALILAKTAKVSGDLLLSLKQIALVERKNAAEYSKHYIRISDSIQQEERNAKDRFARIAYETDEILQQKDKLEEKNRNLFYFFTVVFSLGILLFVIRLQRSKNRLLLLKQQQQQVNEEIYSLMMSQQTIIEENRIREKKRIAQELHDGILGRLFGARLNLDSLNNANDDESVVLRNNYLIELKKIEQDIREISHDLSREKTELINNFVAIVVDLLKEQENSYPATVHFEIDKNVKWEKKNNVLKINLFRILQESLQNINKYANAKNIFVDIIKEEDTIFLKIVDDGKGFQLNPRKKGIGLQNMLSRANDCGGVCEVISKRGVGTTITVRIPILKNIITT